VRTLPQHEAARGWLDDRLNGPARLGLPWPSLLAFLRLTTNPRVFAHQLPLMDAWKQVSSWLGVDRTWIPLPTERHAVVLAGLLPHCEGRPNLLPDAHLAALAIEHGLVLCSADGDFARFPGLRWQNPLKDE